MTWSKERHDAARGRLRPWAGLQWWTHVCGGPVWPIEIGYVEDGSAKCFAGMDKPTLARHVEITLKDFPDALDRIEALEARIAASVTEIEGWEQSAAEHPQHVTATGSRVAFSCITAKLTAAKP